MKKLFISFCLSIICLSLSITSIAQSVDYSVVSVPEESGLDFMMMTSSNDYVCMPQVSRTRNNITWLTNKIIDVSPDGLSIAYLSYRNNTSNIFLKDIQRRGASVQRTNRKAVLDFAYAPDGRFITFSETVGKTNVVFQTNATGGFVCRQITTGSRDYSPIYSKDGKRVFFARQEVGSTSIWSYDVEGNYLSNYTSGMNPCTTDDVDVMLCVRSNAYGKGEIWRVNLNTGVEECILSDVEKSFSTPSVSPDGEWILVVGSTPLHAGDMVYWNTDIYVCRIDGTRLLQLTYHAADDLSPEWSSDGKYIYFISQRGSQDAAANIWRMNFNVL